MQDWAAGRSARRETKNDVDMMSNCQPSLRAMASARGTLVVSMNPNRSRMRENVLPRGSMRTRSAAATRGVSAVSTVRTTFFSCSTL